MVYKCCLPTLHFIHSDCYELFHIQQRPNASQQQTTNTSIIDSTSGDMANLLTNSTNLTPALINTSTTPLLGHVTDKEYCQAKKSKDRFNAPLRTKFYRVRVKP
jgi:hypothetical protein